MQRLLTYTLLICVFTLSLRAQTNETAQTPVQTVKVDIVSLQKELAVQSNEIKNLTQVISYMNETQKKAIDRQYSLMVAFIAIPLAIIAVMVSWRSIRDDAMQKQIDALTRVIEAQTDKNQEKTNP